MATVKIKKLNAKAVVPYKTYDSDFGFDVVATSKEILAPGVIKYGIGLAFQLADDKDSRKSYKRIGFRVAPRSSVWKTGLVLSNSEGIVDEHYRGEVSMVFYHVIPEMPPYEVGDRIGQMYIQSTENIHFEEADKLDDTDRGSGGYGHTGR